MGRKSLKDQGLTVNSGRRRTRIDFAEGAQMAPALRYRTHASRIGSNLISDGRAGGAGIESEPARFDPLHWLWLVACDSCGLLRAGHALTNGMQACGAMPRAHMIPNHPREEMRCFQRLVTA
jgi:hypothetical protein